MHIFKTLTVSALATTLFLGSAFAADLITVPTSTPVDMPIYAEPGFDWSGFYAGIYGVGQHTTVNDTQYGLGVQAGVNAQFEFYLLGGEVAVHGLTGGSGNTSYGQILGRAGLIVSDDVIVYGAAGYGIDLGVPAEDNVLVGGGVEVAVGQNMSLEAQYLHGFPISGGNPKDQVTVGANFHF